MPYIKQEERVLLVTGKKWNGTAPTTPGQLNYLLTNLFLSNNWVSIFTLHAASLAIVDAFLINKTFNYQLSNDVIGALECAKHEYIRRFTDVHPRSGDVIDVLDAIKESFYNTRIAKYEDQKIAENGDVL